MKIKKNRKKIFRKRKPIGKTDRSFFLELDEFLNLGALTNSVAEIVELGATDITAADNLDLRDTGAVDREDTLDALAGLDTADGESLLDAGTASRDHDALELLDTLIVALDDLNRNFNGIADVELVTVLTNLLFTDFVQYRHFQTSFSV